MTEMAEKLKAELLRLPIEDRAELAYYLVCSLDDQGDAESESAWQSELERRWHDMERDAAAGKPFEQVFSELRKKYP
jgi:putative addiction module component (TIGR02574 family)